MDGGTLNKTVVLVVEDDKFFRTLVTKRLSQEGFRVISAENGQEALLKLKEEPRPHVVLLDISLPVLGGFDFLQKIKEDETLKRIPVIVLSNFSEAENIRKARELGAKEYLVKAYFTPADIAEKVKAVIREAYL